MSVCALNSLPKGEYLVFFLILADFLRKSFSGKTSFLVIKSYLLTFPDDKADFLAVSLSKLY